MSFKIVTAVYNDWYNLNIWVPKLKDLNINYVIYEKDQNLKIGQEVTITDNHIRIPNFGKCDYSFLYHIVKNYDCLDDLTLFVKSLWHTQNIPFWEHLEKCKDYDYMQSGVHRKYIYWTDEIDSIRTTVNRDDIEEIHKGGNIFAQTQIDWYHEIYSNVSMPKPFNSWGHGPCFSVSKDLILRHPKCVYMHLLKKFYPFTESWNIEKGLQYYPTIEEQIIYIGKHYHDEFTRFWAVLFTHNVPKNKYKILLT